MSVYMSAVTDLEAQQVQADHGDDGEGWCKFHLRHHRIRIRHGECQAYLNAASVRAAYLRQGTRRPAPSRPAAAQPRPPDRPPRVNFDQAADGLAGAVWRREGF